MFSAMFQKLWANGLIQLGIWETVYMTLIASAFSYLLGLPLGVILSVTDKGGICEKTGKKTKLTGTCEDWRPKR